MKKNLFIIGLVVALAVCLFFLLQPDKQHDTHASEQAHIVANDDSVKAHKGQYLYIIDSLNNNIYQQDVIIKDLLSSQEQTKAQLNSKTAEVKSLAAQIKALNKDTALTAKIDSLVDQVENLTFLLGQYEQYTESINRENDSLKVNYKERDKEKDKRIVELQTAYDGLFKAYQQLVADSRAMAKDLKRQKLKTKIAAVLAGGAAVLGLIK